MWLIFGGTGFLGTALRGLLAARGIPFVAPDSEQCDIRDAAAMGRWMDETSPEVVINCVALTGVDYCEDHPEEARRVNATAPEEMALLCRARGAFLVHFSTDYVFSGSKRAPYVESDLTDPINIYGWTKRLGEEALQARYPDGCLIIRTAWLFWSGAKGFFTFLAGAIEKSQTRLILPAQTGSPTYLGDLAETTLKLVEKRRQGLFHVVNGESADWRTLAEFFLERYPGGESVEISVTDRDDRPARRPAYSVLAVDKLKEKAEIAMRPWREAAKDCVEEMIKKRKEL